MITFDHVSFSYGDTPVIRDVSFSLPSDSAICFRGPSGCGKTTLLRLIAGLEQPSSGQILRPKGLRVAMVFQENRLLPWLTVEQNLALVCPKGHDVRPYLEAVSLAEAREQYPDQLSGGMQRRVALARALAYQGDLLILDEPFTGLNEELCHSVSESVRQFYANKPIVLVTHSLTEPALFNAAVYSLPTPLTGTLF